MQVRFVALAAAALFGAGGCKTSGDASSGLNESVVEAGSGHSGVRLKVLTGRMNQLSQDEIDRYVEAIRAARAHYYQSTDGYRYTSEKGWDPSAVPNAASAPPESEIVACFSACPSRWSDLMTHYYCSLPSYEGGKFPNIRECFSGIVRGPTVDGVKPTYPVGYNFCVTQPVDRLGFSRQGALTNGQVRGNLVYDPQYESEDPPIGPLGWLHVNQGDVFKSVMFATPCTVDPAVQQKAINQFYGVDLKGKTTYTAADTDQVAECKAKRPRWSQDPQDGTHCSHDMRRRQPLADNCYP